MRLGQSYFAAAVLAAAGITSIAAQQPPASAQNQPTRPAAPQNDTARALVARVDLEKFKASRSHLALVLDEHGGIEGTYERVRGILTADRAILETLSQRLLEIEVVDEGELRQIMGLPPREKPPSEERIVETPPPVALGDETVPGD